MAQLTCHVILPLFWQSLYLKMVVLYICWDFLLICLRIYSVEVEHLVFALLLSTILLLQRSIKANSTQKLLTKQDFLSLLLKLLKALIQTKTHKLPSFCFPSTLNNSILMKSNSANFITFHILSLSWPWTVAWIQVLSFNNNRVQLVSVVKHQ